MTHERIGTTLAGKYRLEAVIGEGGMGVVLRATHELLGETVAVKMLSKELAQRPDVVARFQREAKAAVRIKSEHVASVMDFGLTEDGVPFLVMEHLRGRDLEALLAERGRLPVAEAAGYVIEACEALGAAHELGVIHRDIKPANLFLTEVGRRRPIVKVLDFGISKIATDDPGSATRTSAIMGSPAYMSPEQLRSTRDVDARTDVWSLGVVLYELVSGRAPFEGESIAVITADILRSRAPSLASVAPWAPRELVDIVARCLEPTPALRIGDVRELAELLAPLAAGAVVAEGPPSSALPLEIRRSPSAIETDETMMAAGEGPRAQAAATDATVVVPSAPSSVEAPRWRRTTVLGLASSLALFVGIAAFMLQKPGVETAAVSGASEPTAPQLARPEAVAPPVAQVMVTAEPTVSAEPAVSASAPAASPPGRPTPPARPAPSAPSAPATSAPTATGAPADSLPDYGGRK